MEFAPGDDPLDVLERWKSEADSAGAVLTDAMTLCTVDARGRPRGRIVLWKGRYGRSLSFFTNYESAKGRELGVTPFAALVFHFASAERQARVEGSVARLSAEDSDAYFQTRPRESQIGAWASVQSEPLADRELLLARVHEFEERFSGVQVPRPAHWGGFALEAERIELWSGQVGRLHDRAVYVASSSGWDFQRLYP